MIEQIQARLGLDGTAFKKGLTSAKADWKRFTSDIGSNIKSAIGFTAIALGLREIAVEMKELQKSADDVGASLDFMLKLRNLSVTFGGEAGDSVAAMQKLAEAIGAARREGGAAEEKFSQFGISLYEANGQAKTTEQVFKDISNAYKSTEDAALRAAMAMAIFSKTGRNINDILELGSEGIDGYSQKLLGLETGFGKFEAGALAGFWKGVKSATTGAGDAVAAYAARYLAFIKVVGTVAAAPFRLRSMTEEFNRAMDEMMRQEEPRAQGQNQAEIDAAAQMHIKTMDAQLELEEKIKQSKYEQADNDRKILALDQEIKQLMEDAADAAKTEIERIEAKSKLIDKEKEKLKVIGEIENERQKKAEEHMGRMDRLNELKDKQRQAQETVADRARFSLDELANANLRGVRDPGTRADIIKAREVRDLQAKAERERLSGAVGSRERALAFLSRADTIRQGITSLKSDERLTSIDRSLLEMKENEKLMLHYYEDAGVLVRPIMAK
jgi:hypothetical protein